MGGEQYLAAVGAAEISKPSRQLALRPRMQVLLRLIYQEKRRPQPLCSQRWIRDVPHGKLTLKLW